MLKYLLILLIASTGCINVKNEGVIIVRNESAPDEGADNTNSGVDSDSGVNSGPDSSSQVESTPSQDGCPDGYAFVDGRDFLIDGQTVSVSDFCIMKFEARKGVASDEDLNGDGDLSNDYLASIDHTQRPWNTVYGSLAQGACRGHGYDTTTNKGYDIISNLEWMTVAYEIEAKAQNWSEGTVGGGYLWRGHTDNNPSRDLEISDLINPYNQTGNTTGAQKRIYYLNSQDSSGNPNEVWDLGGNLIEIVDWSYGGNFEMGPANCTTSWTNIMTYNCGALDPVYYRPLNPMNIANYNSTDQKLGKIFYNSSSAQGGVMRGGNYTTSNDVGGLFSLTMYSNTINPSDANIRRGFRCVYRF